MKPPAPVRIWAGSLVIPTYLVGEPNRNPMFLEKRVYQGSSGRVYPYPVIDEIKSRMVFERHHVVFLENRYLKLMVMPGFGGRIQFAYDKTNNYSFIYHNRVIKPALVGLAGPWLSGGIEFNWPQHHRPGTYCPVDYTITTNPNGSRTLWLSEIEPMWHLKGTLGLTLHPDKAFLEINIRLFNPTPLPQSFHLWTNPAVHVNDHYQSVFPPDVQAVYDHGKRDVSEFPIARGNYYKVDYSRGVDISWYKNLPVPTSYMAAKSDYNFIGGYDHHKQAGVLHVAQHQVVPGKKQWVWGCGDFGRAWDRNLTDEDGPYAELMCGVFADNQPDFSWLQPFEEKEVKQFFLPYKRIGYVRNATIHAAVSLEIARGIAKVGAYVSSPRHRAAVRLFWAGEQIWKRILNLSPETPLMSDVRLPKNAKPQELRLEVLNAEGEPLVAYTPELEQEEAIPHPATAIPEPAKVGNNEALYLAGLHIEQYRHATREPEDYYCEALRRDPTDARNNNAYGLLLLRRGQFAKAEPLFRLAITSLTRHNPNPADGEPYYNLGICLRYLGLQKEAGDAFYKATWNAAWQDAAFFQLARLSACYGDFSKALDFVNCSLARNARNQKAVHLKTLLLRKLGRTQEALALADAAIERDPLDFGARNERVLLFSARPTERAKRERTGLFKLMRGSPHTHLEIAADYARAGAFDEAVQLLDCAAVPEKKTPAPGHVGETGFPNARPMLAYFAGWFSLLKGDLKAAKKHFRLGAKQNPERCFPNSLDSILVLQAALKLNPRDARAAYYLGNLWYDKRQVAEATACWESSRRADPKFPTVHRNLALVYFNKQRQPAKALRTMEHAFALDPTDARVLYELDLLKRRVGIPAERRMAFLARHQKVVVKREDLFIEFIALLNFFGRHEEALQMLGTRQFHPWEGGEGRVTGQFVISLVELAKRKLVGAKNGAAAEALDMLKCARVYPANLGEGKLHGAQENHILYWLGIAHEQLGDPVAASLMWEEASTGLDVPTAALYYNDQNPETIFYQGLALQKLGRIHDAKRRFEILVNFGKEHLHDHIVVDYFAVSLPEFTVFEEDLDQRNEINCRYLMALGQFGLGLHAQATGELKRVLNLDPSHLPARLHLQQFDQSCTGEFKSYRKQLITNLRSQCEPATALPQSNKEHA
jgi:tetratricopeptide (TPR) repeat protein